MTGTRFVVTVGTDHHPFERLIGWLNDLFAHRPELTAQFFVQYGAAARTPACPGTPFLTADQLDEVLAGADVLICHGGPGSIADAWRRGSKPIVIPRLRRFGEVVDDHQVDFCDKLNAAGTIRLATRASELHSLIGEALADMSGFRLTEPDVPGAPGFAAQDVDLVVARFGELVDGLVAMPRKRRLMTYRTRGLRPRPVANQGAGAAVGNVPPGPVPVAASNSQPKSASVVDASLGGEL